jgi:hypothetical protein
VQRCRTTTAQLAGNLLTAADTAHQDCALRTTASATRKKHWLCEQITVRRSREVTQEAGSSICGHEITATDLERFENGIQRDIITCLHRYHTVDTGRDALDRPCSLVW